MLQKSRPTHIMVTQSPIHKASVFQPVQPRFHQPEPQSAILQSSLSLSVCCSFPPALSLADRSEVADQAGRVSV